MVLLIAAIFLLGVFLHAITQIPKISRQVAMDAAIAPAPTLVGKLLQMMLTVQAMSIAMLPANARK